MKKILFNTVQIVILIYIIMYIFEDIDLVKLKTALASYSSYGLILTVLVVIIINLIYAYRWRYISKNNCSFLASFESIVFGTLLNMILPAKLGEVSRIVYLKKLYKYKINNSISLLFVEKFFDLLLIAISSIIVTTFIINNEQITLIGYSLIFFNILFIVLIKVKVIYKMAIKIPIKFLRVYLRKILFTIYRSFTYVNLTNIFLLTVAIWLVYILYYYVFFNYASGFELNFLQVSVVFVVSFIAFSIPLTPGSIGVLEASLVLTLGWYGIDKEDALVAGLILRILYSCVMLITTLIFLIQKDMSIFKLKKVLS